MAERKAKAIPGGATTKTSGTEAAPVSARDKLKGMLAGRKKAEPPAEAKKKKEGPIINVTDAAVATALEHAAAGSVVVKLLTGPVETAKTEAKDWLLRQAIELWVAGKHRTDNPDFRTPRASGTFQIKAKLSFDKHMKGGPLDQQLREAGLPEPVVEALRPKFVEKVSSSITSFDKLVEGNEAQQAVAMKLMDLIQSEAFTDAERDLLLPPHVEYVEIDGDDFLNFVPTIPGITADQIMTIFSLIKPEMGYNPMNFDGDAVPVLKTLIGDKIPIGEDKK